MGWCCLLPILLVFPASAVLSLLSTSAKRVFLVIAAPGHTHAWSLRQPCVWPPPWKVDGAFSAFGWWRAVRKIGGADFVAVVLYCLCSRL